LSCTTPLLTNLTWVIFPWGPHVGVDLDTPLECGYGEDHEGRLCDVVITPLQVHLQKFLGTLFAKERYDLSEKNWGNCDHISH
jgi:hypothetical protein